MDFPQKVIIVTEAIPYGKVLNYGRLAELLDKPHAARAVGYALSGLPYGTSVPWHRVVGKHGVYGRITIHGSKQSADEQLARLKDEGVAFDGHRQFLLIDYLWETTPIEIAALLAAARHGE